MHKHRLVQSLRPVDRRVSEETLSNVFSTLCQVVNSPVSLKAFILYNNKEWAQLVSMNIDPGSYTNSQEFADDLMITKFLSKFKDFKHEDLKPTESAWLSFAESEKLCLSTNKRFQEYDRDPSKWDPTMLSILLSARRKIAAVLGRPNLDKISEGFGWGPGATTSVSGNRTSAYIKFKAKLDVTSNSLIMGQCCINSTPAWANCQLQTDNFPSLGASLTKEAFNVIRGNEIIVVPKNAKTGRIIAKEPTVNSYLQRGFGRYIRRRLHSHAALDLSDQVVNQRLACLGSRNGSLATIDLKSASDTISTEIVKFLLPNDWFLLLDSIRSKQGYLRHEDHWIYFQKFSSAGNGFTFELETLIFWALIKSVSDANVHSSGLVHAYGDDLIVPTCDYEMASKVLEYAGFTVNKQKSFSSGPFRESCGKDYFNGILVRPVFLKENLSNVESIYKLANSLRRYSHSRNFNYGCDIRFHSAWQYLVYRLPQSFRDLKIPDGYGDSGLLCNLDEATPYSTSQGVGWERVFVCKHIVHIPIKELMKDQHAAYAAKLYESGSDMPSFNYHGLRKMTTPTIKKLIVPFSNWYDLGPWC